MRQFCSLGIADKVVRYEPKISQRDCLSRKANAHISLVLSHHSLLSEAKALKFGSILILEDDFYFHNDHHWTCKKLQESWQDLPKDWDIFYFGNYFVQGYAYPPAVSFSKNLVRVQTGFCAHAIAYSQKGIKMVLEELKVSSESEIVQFSNNFESIDWFLVRCIQMYSKCFAPRELLCIQSKGHSDIEGQTYDYSQMLISSYKTHIMGMDSLS